MKQKTALQQCIESIESIDKDFTLLDRKATINMLKSLRPTEREHINKAYNDGNTDPNQYNFPVDYFTDNFQ